MPLSAAQMAFASAAFSALPLQKAEMLGVHADKPAQDGFVAIWRYAAWLFGVPETILFRDYDEAMELCRTAFVCEPPPAEESIIMANGLINSAPLIVGAEGAARRAFLNFVYRTPAPSSATRWPTGSDFPGCGPPASCPSCGGSAGSGGPRTG